MQEFDRIFDRDDVIRRCLVAMVDHRRDRRGLAGAGGAHHQDEPALHHDEVLEHVGQAQLIEPSIFTLIGELDVKNKSDALRSTMSLNSGRVLSTIGAPSDGSFTSMVSTNFSFTAAISALGVFKKPGC